MLLQPDLQLSPFDTQRWVINTPTGHNLLINQATVRLVRLLQQAPDLEQARTQFNQEFGAALPAEEFSRLLQQRLGGYGILPHDGTPLIAPTADYIKLRVQLLPPAAAAWCAAPLRPLYTPRFFWPALGTLLGVLLLCLLFVPGSVASSADYWVAIPLIYASIFVHEFGHIAACSRFGVRHGGIGFGFYLFLFPVLYADVTNIWQIDRHRRIITNLGGIFSQLLYAGLLVTAYRLTAYSPLLLAATTTAGLALWQFNPFIRRDGYWLLADLTNTPNLLQKAAAVTRRSWSGPGIRRAFSTRGRELTGKPLFLLLYGTLNASLLVVFAGYTLVRYQQQVLHFPGLAWALLGKMTAGTLALADLRQVKLIVLAFYVMLLRAGFLRLQRAIAPLTR